LSISIIQTDCLTYSAGIHKRGAGNDEGSF
jgi:hypothetical protein